MKLERRAVEFPCPAIPVWSDGVLLLILFVFQNHAVNQIHYSTRIDNTRTQCTAESAQWSFQTRIGQESMNRITRMLL